MKKWISICLCAVLLLGLCLSFSGCTPTDAERFQGKWEIRVDMARIIAESATASGGEDANAMMKFFDFKDLLLKMTMEFKEDGTYACTVDEASLDAMLDKVSDIMVAGLEDYFADQIRQAGLSMTVDELLKLSGTSLEALAEELDKEMKKAMDEEKLEMNSAGTYKVEEGKLYTSDDLEAQIDPAEYMTYEIVSDTQIKLLAVVGGDEELTEEEKEVMEVMLPLVMEKI